MTSVVVVDGGGSVVEYVSNMENPHQEEDQEVDGYPAVIVEPVPSAHLEPCYAAQVLVYDNDTYLVQDVAEEQEVETEVVDTVEASVHGSNANCPDKTIEAAEALLHMDPPSSLRGDRSPVEECGSPCVTTPEFIHAAMRPEVITETVVEVSTEDSEPMEVCTVFEAPLNEPIKKKKAGRKPKVHQAPVSNGSPDLGIKKKPREGKGNTTYLWEFLLDLLQDKNTCPRYIKWTQREKGIFKLVDSKAVSRLWGKHKNKPDMNYETMGRALRYYYQRGILSKVEGQRLVYQFKEMPKNIVVIDDDKSDTRSEELLSAEKACERVPPSSETLLSSPDLSKTTGILRGSVHAVVHPTPAKSKNELSQTTSRMVTVTTASDASQLPQQSHSAIIAAASGPRTVRVAMQVPVVMTTSGQKISTVAMHSGSSPILTSASSATAQKVVIQTIPTVIPATVENGEKITVQLAKIITIPAAQLAQCQLQSKTGQPGTSGINLVGAPLAVRTLAPVSVSPGTQVVRLAVPAQQPQHQQSSPVGGSTPARVISAIIKRPEAKMEGNAMAATEATMELHPGQDSATVDAPKVGTATVPATVETEARDC
ncbi:ETS-related transcription factor Elf-2-like isoform X1 [Arapaima gigas]